MDLLPIEKLRDILDSLKQDAIFLYQYGNLGNSLAIFNGLLDYDKKRLLYLALTKEDKDVQNVGLYLLKKLYPTIQNKDEFLSQFSREDNVDLLGSTDNAPAKQQYLTPTDKKKIKEELKTACDRIGFLKIEEAYWILISNTTQDPIWIEAVESGDEVLSKIRFFDHIEYNPHFGEKNDLITTMRKSQWILHVHNHPDSLGYISICRPSDNDKAFALQWKSEKQELKEKMKFFVIKERNVLEYALPQNETKQWKI